MLFSLFYSQIVPLISIEKLATPVMLASMVLRQSTRLLLRPVGGEILIRHYIQTGEALVGNVGVA